MHKVSHKYLGTQLKLHILAGFILTLFWHKLVYAQTTSGIMNPEVRSEERAYSFRVAAAQGDTISETNIAARAYLQKAVTDNFQGRLTLEGHKTDRNKFSLHFVQLGLQWQVFEEERHGWAGAFRIDSRLAKDQKSQIGFNWASQAEIYNTLSVRHMLGFTNPFDRNDQNSTNFSSRLSFNYEISSNIQLSLQLYSDIKSTTGLKEFQEQDHRIGPGISLKVAEGTSLFTGPLFGMSDAANDLDMRLWLTQKF